MSQIYQFGEYQLNAGRRTLRRGATPLPITARALDILLVLVEQRHRVVEKDELLARVWPDQIVEEGNLSQQIFVVRRLLGGGEYIATVPRRGYQFVGTVEETAAPAGRSPVARPASVLRLSVALDPPIVFGPNPALAMARDGSVLVYVGEDEGTTSLFVRRLDSFETRRVAGTRDASAPFLSPDARWIGFAASGRLHRISVDGGTALAICEVDGAGRGASWGPDNLIAFAPVPAGPIFVVAATGGTSRPLTRLAYMDGERSHRFPSFTPDGRHLIFTIARAGDLSFDHARLATATLTSDAHRVILEGGSCGAVSGTSRLHYQRASMLFVTEFDPLRGTCDHAGEPQETVAVHDAGAAHVAAADSGLLIYAPAMPPLAPARLIWRDAEGLETTVDSLPGAPEEPRISPDGTRVVVGLRAETSDLWLYNIERRTLSRLTEDGDNFAAIWTPDGEAIVFSSNRGGPSNMFRLPIGAPDAALPLVESASEQVPGAWTPTGDALLFTQYDADRGASVWRLGNGARAEPLLRSRFNELAPAVSSNGRWLAYTSDASGVSEVYVIRYPELTHRQQVSQGGGAEPVWAPFDSRGLAGGRPPDMRLYFRAPRALIVVDIDDGGGVTASRELARDRYLRGSPTGLPNYDVHPDGRLLLVAPPDVRTTRAHLNAVVPSAARQ